MERPKLTIIIPAYNEINTLQVLIDKIDNLDINKQVILIDDGSTDGTNKLALENKDKIDKIIVHEKNKEKGAAIKSAQNYVIGEYVIIQDADWSTIPKDIYNLLSEIQRNVK